MADSLVSLIVLDDAGKRKSLPAFFTSSVTVANMQTFTTAFAPLVDDVIDGQIVAARVELDLTLPGGLKSAPVADSTVRRGGVFSFANPSRFAWSNYLPAIALAQITAGNIDLASAEMIAFVAAYVTGAGGFTPSNGLGLDLTSLNRATESFRKA